MPCRQAHGGSGRLAGAVYNAAEAEVWVPSCSRACSPIHLKPMRAKRLSKEIKRAPRLPFCPCRSGRHCARSTGGAAARSSASPGAMRSWRWRTRKSSNRESGPWAWLAGCVAVLHAWAQQSGSAACRHVCHLHGSSVASTPRPPPPAHVGKTHAALACPPAAVGGACRTALSACGSGWARVSGAACSTVPCLLPAPALAASGTTAQTAIQRSIMCRPCWRRWAGRTRQTAAAGGWRPWSGAAVKHTSTGTLAGAVLAPPSCGCRDAVCMHGCCCCCRSAGAPCQAAAGACAPREMLCVPPVLLPMLCIPHVCCCRCCASHCVLPDHLLPQA